MSGIKQQIAEKSVDLIAAPAVQKAFATVPIMAGGASVMEYTQGWMAVASIAVGIVAGVLVIIYNWKRNKLITKELQIKEYELAKLKEEQNESHD